MCTKKMFNPLIALLIAAHSLGLQADDDFERNQKIAAEQYERIQREREAEAYRRYLQNKDREDGISQKSGVVGGRTSDGNGAWVGYRFPTN